MTVVPHPSVVNGLSGSKTVHLTVTLLRYQPLGPSVPVTCGATNGGDVSTSSWSESENGPALQQPVYWPTMIRYVRPPVSGNVAVPPVVQTRCVRFPAASAV